MSKSQQRTINPSALATIRPIAEPVRHDKLAVSGGGTHPVRRALRAMASLFTEVPEPRRDALATYYGGADVMRY